MTLRRYYPERYRLRNGTVQHKVPGYFCVVPGRKAQGWNHVNMIGTVNLFEVMEEYRTQVPTTQLSMGKNLKAAHLFVVGPLS